MIAWFTVLNSRCFTCTDRYVSPLRRPPDPPVIWFSRTQRLSRVNANVNVPMSTADEQIRVSDRVKRVLDRRRREGESYNDVLERILDEEDDRDLLAGFGRWSDDHADRVREAREAANAESKDRMRRLADDE